MNRGELAQACLAVEKAGGSVRDYLSDAGYISPWGTWFRLQKEELGRRDHQITDGKGNEEMRKLTLEDKKTAVETALNGGNPLEYLKKRGCGNPSASWAYIKKVLKAADPQKYAALEHAREEKQGVATCCAPAKPSGVEVPDELPEEEPTEEPTEDIHADALGRSAAILEKAQETPEVVLTIKSEDLTRALDETPHVSSITKPLNYEGFDVRCIESKQWGRFFYDEKHGLLNWTSVDGEEVSFSPESWITFATGILPKAMAILGISVKFDKNRDEI